MRVLESISELKKVKSGCVLTIGNFDGVHYGHQEILSAAKKISEKYRAECIAMTFEPHPVAILYPEKAPGVLTAPDVKKYLLAQCGIDSLIVLKDSKSLLNLTPEDFIDKFIVENIHPCAVVEGDDFNFGAKRAGNIDTLKKLGTKHGFDVSVVEAKQITLSTGQVVRVSSTMIRYMLESGHVTDAAAALGRPYRLVGEIIPGRGIGRKLGFPTLNMKRSRQVIPAEGVYAGFVRLGQTIEELLSSEEKIAAAYSIGQARTYGDEFPLLIEAHLLKDNIGEPAGKLLAMDFVERIRSQHKFKNPEELSAQIAKDCRKAKELLFPAEP
ncbi:MAG: bifunctional riboflavin kinase/FAD synthetase [Sedimentisphaerales bacterium]|nr:bifunctional riboflavin kinase/FAD synthetase [Sedimentisphaerales bacterium]